MDVSNACLVQGDNPINGTTSGNLFPIMCTMQPHLLSQRKLTESSGVLK